MRWLVALLTGAMLLTAYLAYQARYAAKRRHDAAARVVRDYATLCADELIDRANGEINYQGFYHVLGAMGRQEDAHPMQPLLTDAEIAKEVTESGVRTLSRFRFRFDLQGDAVDVTAGMPEELRLFLHDRLYSEIRKQTPSMQLRARHVRAGGTPYTLVYAVAPPQRRAHRVALGFVLNDAALTPFIQRAFDTKPLLPPSLGALDNQVLNVELHDAENRLLFQRGGAFDPLLGVDHPARVDESDLFSGAHVRVSIAAAATPKLVIGGIPRGNDGALLTALAGTALLLLAAILLMRREQKLAQLRSDFVSGVSHELRTPLTQIRMFAETLLLERTRSEEERRRSLSIIDQEARRLAHLVDNTLLFARGERGSLQLTRREGDLVDALKQTVEAFAPIAAARKCRVTLEGEASYVTSFDAEALRQIALNLLDNAVKYGPANGAVRMVVRAGEDEVEISVEDSGAGIPPGTEKKIFQRFVRLERESSGSTGGAGIGLAVVRELVELHGGVCGVRSRNGGGSVFHFTIPDTPLQSTEQDFEELPT